MKRILLYIGILAVVLVAPVNQLDVAKLRPVQVVSVCMQNDWIVIETDTEDMGTGATAKEALKNMEDTTPGVIYLDTAQYLVFTKDAEDAVEDLRDVLKPDTQLCYLQGQIPLDEAGNFLAAHGDLPKLKDWQKGQKLPIITTYKEKLTFLKKVENSA